MKRFIIALLMLGTLIAGCVWSYYQVFDMSHAVAGQLDAVENLAIAGDFDTANEKLAGVYTDWKAKKRILGALVRHTELDDIENLFLRTMQSLQNKDINEYRMQNRELYGMLIHLPEMELPNLTNIF